MVYQSTCNRNPVRMRYRLLKKLIRSEQIPHKFSSMASGADHKRVQSATQNVHTAYGMQYQHLRWVTQDPKGLEPLLLCLSQGFRALASIATSASFRAALLCPTTPVSYLGVGNLPPDSWLVREPRSETLILANSIS